MKRLGKELVTEIIQQNGIEQRRFESNKVIYERDGKEVIHVIKGYRAITRDENGKAVMILNWRSIPALSITNITDIIKG